MSNRTRNALLSFALLVAASNLCNLGKAENTPATSSTSDAASKDADITVTTTQPPESPRTSTARSQGTTPEDTKSSATKSNGDPHSSGKTNLVDTKFDELKKESSGPSHDTTQAGTSGTIDKGKRGENGNSTNVELPRSKKAIEQADILGKDDKITIGINGAEVTISTYFKGTARDPNFQCKAMALLLGKVFRHRQNIGSGTSPLLQCRAHCPPRRDGNCW